MDREKSTEVNSFRIRTKDVFWTTKVFVLAATCAFILGIITYILTLTFAEPEPVSQAIMSTASAATAKVEVTANYISPMWAIFIFNSIAALSAVIGTGLFMAVHHMLIGDIAMRPEHPFYTRFSVTFEKMMMPAYSLLIRITTLLDRDFSLIEISGDEKENTIWKYCGYGKDEYRMFSYILPYTVPLLILIVNGFLMGILLSFFTFTGAMVGYELFGIKGIIIGLMYNMVYFFISIIPHGIIEIPAILVAAALGYRFAYIQAHAVIEKNLFNTGDISILKSDAAKVFASTRDFLRSSHTWKMIMLIVLTLLIAAYIETYVTLGIVDRVMQFLDTFIENRIS
ncbi:MAG: stage II sporulation protein M [Methanolobus sp.]